MASKDPAILERRDEQTNIDCSIAFLLAMLVLAALSTRRRRPPRRHADPAIELIPTSGAVKASGELVPAERSGFPHNGRVQSVAVEAGDMVEAGMVWWCWSKRLPKVVQAASCPDPRRSAIGRIASRTSRPGDRCRPGPSGSASPLVATQRRRTLMKRSPPPRPNWLPPEPRKRNCSAGREAERIAALATLSNAEAALQQAQVAYDRWPAE